MAMTNKSIKSKLLAAFLTFCMVLSLMPAAAFAADIQYISKVDVAYTSIDYKAGDTPQTTASVTNHDAHCTVAYEYWREIYQPEEGGVWHGTGRYWYSDPEMMASLSADKRITQFEAGHHYSYNIVLVTDSGYFFSDDSTVVSVGEYEWGTPDRQTNLEIKEMSTKLYIYSPYSIDVPDDSSDKIISTVDVQNATLAYASGDSPVATATGGSGYEVYDEYWEEMASDGNGGVVPVKYWHSNAEENARVPEDKRITTFEEGKSYMYSLTLKAVEGHTFSDDCTMTLNGNAVNQRNVMRVNENTLFAVALKTMKPTQTPRFDVIDEIGIDQAKTTSYKVGDAPTATAFSYDKNQENYTFYEKWEEIDGGLVWYSDETVMSAVPADKRITTFEAGKTYSYSIIAEANENYIFASKDTLQVSLNRENISNTDKVRVSDNGTRVEITGEPMTPFPFTDVAAEDWFCEDVEYVWENGLMKGTDDAIFSPYMTTTRGMIVTVLYRLENEPAVSGTCPFDDVKPGKYYEDAITWASENEIVEGYGKGKFGPNDNITREQMATILYRYAAFKGYDVSEQADLTGFADYTSIHNWALNAMAWANAKDLVRGLGHNVLSPAGDATRAQVAAILHRFCEKVVK